MNPSLLDPDYLKEMFRCWADYGRVLSEFAHGDFPPDVRKKAQEVLARHLPPDDPAIVYPFMKKSGG